MTVVALNIYPTRQRFELNDKATKLLFNQTDSRFLKMVGGEATGRITEKRKHGKKHEIIRSGYTLETSNGFTFIAALDEYDRAVLNVCVSEYENGARYITLAAIQRGLSGKNCNDKDHYNAPYKNQLTRLKQAIDRLMACQYDPEILEAYAELNYEGAETVEKAQVLPAERLKKRIGGKVIEVLHFLDESPLSKTAKIKGQLLTYDAELLDVSDQQNTPLIIMLKNYTLRRVLECQKHRKQFKPVLTLDDIFKKCRIADKRKAKEHARGYINVFFKHLQEKGVIKSYEFTKKGNKFYSIKFNF